MMRMMHRSEGIEVREEMLTETANQKETRLLLAAEYAAVRLIVESVTRPEVRGPESILLSLSEASRVYPGLGTVMKDYEPLSSNGLAIDEAQALIGPDYIGLVDYARRHQERVAEYEQALSSSQAHPHQAAA